MPRPQDPALLRSIGGRIRALREGRRWTQEQLGERVGIPAPTISRIETGSHGFTLTTAANFARVFGVSLGALFDAPRATAALTGDEEVLLGIWRQIPEDRRSALVQVLEWCAVGEEGAQIAADGQAPVR